MDSGTWWTLLRLSTSQQAAMVLPPAAAGAMADIEFAQGLNTTVLDIPSGFSGGGLTFALAPASNPLPAGLSLADNGVISGVPSELVSGRIITIRATNTEGSADNTFSISVFALDFTAGLSGLTTNLTHGPSAQSGEPVTASADAPNGPPPPSVAYQWKTLESGEIVGATSAVYVPDASLLDGERLYCTVTPALYPAKDTAAFMIRHAAPAVALPLMDEIFDLGSGPQLIDASLAFSGDALAYSVTGTGAAIDPISGLLTITTDLPLDGEIVMVTASNSGGSVQDSFLLTVESTADMSTTFGALTVAGEGGVPVEALSIASGDPSGHWEITNGHLAPSVAGANAGLDAGIYALALDDGMLVDVSVVADRRDVRNSAELQSTYPDVTGTALEGKVIGFRDGTYEVGSVSGFGGTLGAYVKWTSISGNRGDVTLQNTVAGRLAEIQFAATGEKHLEIDSVTIRCEQDTVTLGSGQANRIGVVEIRNGGNVLLSNCDISCDLLPWRKGGTPRRQICGVHSRFAGNVTVRNCEIHNVVVGVALDSGDGLTVEGTDIHTVWADCIDIIGGSGSPGLPASNVTLKNNIGHDFCGDYAYLHSDFIQFFNDSNGNPAASGEDMTNVEIAGNIFYPGVETLLMAPTYTNGNATIRRPTSQETGTFITANKTLSAADLHFTQAVVAIGGEVVITIPLASGFANNDTFVISRVGGGIDGLSDSPVRVRVSGTNSIAGYGSEIVLDDTTENTVVISRASTVSWARRLDGPTIQGFLVQDLGDYPNGKFRGLKIHGNIIFGSNTNAATIGNLGNSMVQDCRVFNNSFIELHPGDRNGDGVTNGLDGTTRGALEIDMTGTDDCIAFRNVASATDFRGPGANLPKFLSQITYATLNNPAQGALYANQTGSLVVAPATLSEARSLARPAASGALDLGAGAWAGAIGPTDAEGYWNPSTGAPNEGFGRPPVQFAANPGHGAADVGGGTTIELDFDQPISLGTGTVTIRRDAGAGFVDHQIFDVGMDVEDAPADGNGTPGKLHLEGDALLLVPSSPLPEGSTYAIRVDQGAIVGVYGDAFAGITDDTTLNFSTSGGSGSVISLGMQNSAASASTHDFTFTLDAASTQFVMIAGRFDGSTITSVEVLGESATVATRQALFKNGNYGVAIYEISGLAASGAKDIRLTLSSPRSNIGLGVYEAAGKSFARAMQATAQGGNNAGAGGGQEIANPTNTTSGETVLAIATVGDGSSAGFSGLAGYQLNDASNGTADGSSAMLSTLSVGGGSPEDFSVTYGVAFKASVIAGIVLS